MKWSENELKVLVDNYKSKTNEELSKLIGRSKSSIFCKLNELGLKKPTSFKSNNRSKINKSMGRDLSKENVKEIALKYNSRGEFKIKDQSAYNAARNGQYLDEICQHMSEFYYSTPQLILKNIIEKTISKNISYNNRKVIPPYELDIYIPEFKLAFEFDGKHWHSNLENDIRKDNICKEKNITLIRIPEDRKVSYEVNVKSEFINKLDLINKLTNRNITKEEIYSIDISDIQSEILTKQKVKQICLSYDNYWKFRKEQGKIYQRLLKLNKLNDYTLHMKRKFVK